MEVLIKKGIIFNHNEGVWIVLSLKKTLCWFIFLHFLVLVIFCFYPRVLTLTITWGPANGGFLIQQIKSFPSS